VDLIQVCALANDGAAWEEFVTRFFRPIALSIIRTAYRWGGFPQQVVEDLVQDTFLKLCTDRCRLLHAFAKEHPEAIEGYIRAIAANVAHDHFKSLHSQKRGSGMVAQLIDGVDQKANSGDFGAQDTMEREILLKEIDECLLTCSEGSDQERDRIIFWLYYRQGLSAKAISLLPTVELTAKGVESAIFRLTHLVREKLVNLRHRSSLTSGTDEKGFRSAESYS
jgi:RNA polymerase sigma-70 factor, ECF subfamily